MQNYHQVIELYTYILKIFVLTLSTINFSTSFEVCSKQKCQSISLCIKTSSFLNWQATEKVPLYLNSLRLVNSAGPSIYLVNYFLYKYGWILDILGYLSVFQD